jgi:hypothetical protein
LSKELVDCWMTPIGRNVVITMVAEHCIYVANESNQIKVSTDRTDMYK